MIMQAVSLLSLNVLMGFFSLIRLHDELPILLLTIVRTREERISLLNKNERRKRELKKKKYLLIGDGSLFMYIN
jgi:hypothetical protein